MPGQENGQRGREDNGSGRTYPGVDGERWPSMTTLTGLLPGKAQGLAAWRARVGDEEADRVMRSAVERGNRIHDAIEAFGERAWILQSPEPWPLEASCPQAVKDWLGDNVAEIIGQEVTLANRHERYAGTTDIFGRLVDGRPFVLDWKTGKRRPDHAVQVVGYADCDLRLDGREWAPFDELADPEVVCLIGYVEWDDESGEDTLYVQVIDPEHYGYLRSVRRGLRDTWSWYEKPGRLVRRFRTLTTGR